MEKHLSSFRLKDGAYNIVVSRAVGNMVDIPADVTKFDMTRGVLRLGIQYITGMGAAVATGWGLRECAFRRAILIWSSTLSFVTALLLTRS